MSDPTPNIVVADGATLNLGDLDWSPLERLGNLRVFDHCGKLLVQRCKAADVVLTNKEVFDRSTIEALPQLRYLSVLATGTNVVDLSAARDSGLLVSNVPNYSTPAVAQHVFALILELLHQNTRHDAAARDGRWAASNRFSLCLSPFWELQDKKLGIVGLGNIGKRVAEIGKAFGMQVIAANQRSTPQRLAEPVQWLPLDSVFAQADILSLHCPLTPTTRHLVNRESLARMKPEALLINTGRGPLIDEVALAQALEEGLIGGAGLDVLCTEPVRADNPLLGAPRCLITPHLAWASTESRRRLLTESAKNVQAFVAGRPRNLVT